MNKKIKKGISIFIAAAALSVCSAAAVACGDDGDGKTDAGERSGLIGGFESQESISVELTSDTSLLGGGNEHGEKYLYTSDVYPLNTVVGSSIGGVKYNVYQKLRLRRDYSYEYNVEIMVRMVGESNINLVKLEATTFGTFTYVQHPDDPDKYTVTVSDPERGSEKRYGAYITGENNIYSWKISSAPNYVIDVERILAEKKSKKSADGEEPIFDRYIRGRQVEVRKIDTERVLYHDVFYVDFMNDLAPYCSYDSSSVPNEEKPDVPVPPDPPTPPVEEAPSLVEIGNIQNCGIALRFGSPLSVVMTYPDKTVKTATFGGVTADGKVSGDNSVFEFPIEYARLGDAFSATVGNASFSIVPTELIAQSFGSGGDGLRGAADACVAANIMNVAAVFGADGATVTDDMKQYIFDASQSVYQGAQWGKRDNMDVKDTDKKTAEFAWERVPESTAESGAPTLRYKFKLNPDSHGKISVKSTIGGREYAAQARELDEKILNGEAVGDNEKIYAVDISVNSPVMFADEISLEVYDADSLMSVATYSVNRALAKAFLNNGTELKTQADALWSLAKSAAWSENFDDVRYVYNFDAGNCNYSFAYGEYAYTVAAPVPDYGEGVWGTRIYVGGKLVHDNSGEVKDENNTFTASRGAATEGKYPFTVALDGANIDGVSVADTGGGHGSITLNVLSDSTLALPLFFNNTAGTINADCDVIIRGESGAVLTVIGNIFTTGNLTIENVNVKVIAKGDGDGVSCNGLTISNGGGLSVEHVGNTANVNNGVKLGGNAVIDGNLAVNGFDCGVYLCDGTAEQTFVVNGGKVDIEGLRYGINASDVFDDPSASTKHYLSRELYFNGGVTHITVSDKENGIGGVAICNITLGDAELYIDVVHGDGIAGKSNGWWNEWAGVWESQTSLPTVIRTSSGSEKRGELSIIVRGGGIVATVGEMALNGGNVYLYGETPAKGFVQTVNGTVITAENCDLTMENGAGVNKSGRAITAEEGDETFTVTNSAKVVFKNCDVPVACWGAKTGAFAKLVNDGLIIIDTYKVGFAQWELNSWQIKLQVENNGEVRTTNQVA